MKHRLYQNIAQSDKTICPFDPETKAKTKIYVHDNKDLWNVIKMMSTSKLNHCSISHTNSNRWWQQGCWFYVLANVLLWGC